MGFPTGTGLIVFVEIVVHGGFEIADGAEDAAPEPALGECSEETPQLYAAL